MDTRFPQIHGAMRIREQFDGILNHYNMQQVTVAALVGMVLWAAVLGALGVIDYLPADILAGAALAVAVAVAVNSALAALAKAKSELSSSVITALILALIVPPGLSEHWVFITSAAAVASASKYVVAADKQHVFNPAAVALVALALLFQELTAAWWVGTPEMLPAVLVLGGLVVRKTRRTGVVVTFIVVYAVVFTVAAVANTWEAVELAEAWRTSLGRSPLVYFAFIMMTDPITVPSHRLARPLYVSLVALLYVTPELQFLPFALTPEQALCAGNAVSFLVRPRYRLSVPLIRKYRVGTDTWAFEFGPKPRMTFAPGQFMEWTLPHSPADRRGQRRYFTIASSPAEDHLTVIMRVPPSPSTFKRALVTATDGTQVVAARLGGDFVLPRDLRGPIAFIAGGVGVAPFRSMARHIVDTGKTCDAVLVYSNWRADDILFRETFDSAEAHGLRTVYVLTDTSAAPVGWKGPLGLIDAEMIGREIPDYRIRTFYVSGPQTMVRSIGSALRGLGVPRSRIHRDYFDGATDA